MLIMKLTLPSPTTTGPDVLSPQSTKQFFQPDVWNFPPNMEKRHLPLNLDLSSPLFLTCSAIQKRLPKSSGLQSSSRPYPLFHKTSVLFQSMRSQPILKMNFLTMLHWLNTSYLTSITRIAHWQYLDRPHWKHLDRPPLFPSKPMSKPAFLPWTSWLITLS